jgi:hypothetical protein
MSRWQLGAGLRQPLCLRPRVKHAITCCNEDGKRMIVDKLSRWFRNLRVSLTVACNYARTYGA